MRSKIITFGEIMMRLATPGFSRFGQQHYFESTFGGGEANVAVSLGNFGMNVEFVTRLPENDIANACIAELKGLGVGTSYILRGGSRMGIYFIEKGAVSRASKVIYDRTDSSFSAIDQSMINWKEVLQEASWFHWSGITPAVSEGAAFTCLEGINVANDYGITVSCDLNYRKKLWNYGKKATEIMPQLVAGCDIVMGNEEDAQMCLDITPERTDITKNKIDTDAYKEVSKKSWKGFLKSVKLLRLFVNPLAPVTITGLRFFGTERNFSNRKLTTSRI